MQRTTRLPFFALIAGITFAAVGGWLANAQQQTIKRTDLLKVDLPDIKGSQMNMWIADWAPGADTGRHIHPTPRFVYVLEGTITMEMEGKTAQTFKAGQSFVEMPNMVHAVMNTSTTEPAKSFAFQYAAEGQALQVNAP
jgi:quercetin dioxygenase-like cupin family protein